jgi:hypothetical protein
VPETAVGPLASVCTKNGLDDQICSLRRRLIESGWLCRINDGSKYWKNPEKKQEDA